MVAVAQAALLEVVGVDEHDPPPALHAAVAVVEPVDRRVVLVVRAHRLEQQPPLGEPDRVERVDRTAARGPSRVGKRRSSRGGCGSTKPSGEPLLEALEARARPRRSSRARASSRPRTPPTGSRGSPSSVRRASPQTIATSERSSSEAGSRRPREACTMLIESSTETTCSPDAWTSRSLRPSVGQDQRLLAGHEVRAVQLRRDVHRQRACRRSASAVASVSGAARRKLPPSAMNTCARPVAHRPDALDDVVAVLARRLEAERLARAGRGSRRVGRSQIPIVRSPCTLLCPRTGQRPAPGRPMLPRSSRKLTISRIVATALRCCVRPIAQQTIVRSDSAASVGGAARSPRARGRSRTRRPPTTAPRARARSSSKPSQCASTNSRSTAPASTIRRFSALKQREVAVRRAPAGRGRRAASRGRSARARSAGS